MLGSGFRVDGGGAARGDHLTHLRQAEGGGGLGYGLERFFQGISFKCQGLEFRGWTWGMERVIILGTEGAISVLGFGCALSMWYSICSRPLFACA